MFRFLHYFGRFQNFQGSLGAMSAWKRAVLIFAALPGLVLIGLSAIAFAISILTLLILTVPVYRLLTLLTPRPAEQNQEQSVETRPRQRRPVDVTIIE